MAMFESLSKRLEGVFTSLSGKGKLTEADVDEAMREVRLALLEADVSLKLVRQFVERVKVKAIGTEVLGSFSPAQQVLQIVNDELVEMLGGNEGKNKLDLGGQPPNVIMLVGLQGAGKTTAAAKLANFLRKQGQRPLMVEAFAGHDQSSWSPTGGGDSATLPSTSVGLLPLPPYRGEFTMKPPRAEKPCAAYIPRSLMRYHTRVYYD